MVDWEFLNEYIIRPAQLENTLTRDIAVVNETGQSDIIKAINEQELTIFLNNQEIVTTMTIGDYPEYLALGFLKNQAMINDKDEITALDYDDDVRTIVVRTAKPTQFQQKMRKKIRTSGCAMGTIFGDIMDDFQAIKLGINWQLGDDKMVDLLHKIGLTPSLYLSAGAIHGCALCVGDRPIIYMEDVGRHNAVDKIAGYMHQHNIGGHDKIFYTTGRLTSEMVIKTALMGIPILLSRSGFTIYAIQLAQQCGLTMVARAKGKRFMVLTHPERIIFNK